MTPLDPAAEARIFALERPDPALMKVYLVRAFGAALGFVLLAALVAFKFGHADVVVKLLGELASRGVLPLAVGGLYLGGYVIAAVAFFVRFKTLHYRFDHDGVAQKWGLLFRRESFLAYARIQDVKVSQGFVERAFGLGTVRIQTAGADKGAEESIEGLREHELVGEFLKARTRGGKVGVQPGARPAGVAAKLAPERDPLHVLGEIRDEVRALRGLVERRR